MGLRQSQAHTEHRIGPKPTFVGSGVEGNHCFVSATLICRVAPDECGAQFTVDVCYGLGHAFAQIARAAITQFHGFVFSSGSTRWHDCRADCATVEMHIDFDRGVAARIKHFAPDYVDDVHGAPNLVGCQ